MASLGTTSEVIITLVTASSWVVTSSWEVAISWEATSSWEGAVNLVAASDDELH